MNIIEMLIAALIATVVFTTTIPAYAIDRGDALMPDAPSSLSQDVADMEAADRLSASDRPNGLVNYCGIQPASNYIVPQHCFDLGR
jgi:hypothetical protein